MPKEAYDALMQQLSTLQATVDRLTALLEEKEQSFGIRTGRGSGRAARNGRMSSTTDS